MMLSQCSQIGRVVAWVMLGLSLDLSAQAQTPAEHLADLVPRLGAELQARGIAALYERYEGFVGDMLDERARPGAREGSEFCRLSWNRTMLSRPLESLDLAESFTRALYEDIRDNRPLNRTLTQYVAPRLDAVVLPEPAPSTDFEAILETAALALESAFAPLAATERAALRQTLLAQTCGPDNDSHGFADPEAGRRLCKVLDKMDRSALIQAVCLLPGLTRTGELARARAQVEGLARLSLPGVEGEVIGIRTSACGRIVLGGPGPNTYRLDEELRDVCLVLEPGGDDTYLEGATSDMRPVLAILDFGGNDVYRGRQPGIQGGAVMGLSLLVDVAGDDVYEAVHVAQGACLVGAGLLMDLAGNDRFLGDRRVQGHGLCGVGALLDRSGEDTYRAALLAQGVGAPLGFGLLADLAGNDHYYAGGKYRSPYDDSPGYAGWSQGVGMGARGSGQGGVGVLLDGGGDDVYECDYFSHGGGYWFSLGFARDFGGNDQRVGSTRTAWDGGERNEKRFLRWGLGFGCHYAAGFLFDDAGDDSYECETAGLAFGWDVATGALCDFAGHDRYKGGSMGNAANASVAILLDAAGADRYVSGRFGRANPQVDYHPAVRAGGNFSFVVDLGGSADEYPAGVTNNAAQHQGWAGGILLDR